LKSRGDSGTKRDDKSGNCYPLGTSGMALGYDNLFTMPTLNLCFLALLLTVRLPSSDLLTHQLRAISQNLHEVATRHIGNCG
jgi:hypothetical protein